MMLRCKVDDRALGQMIPQPRRDKLDHLSNNLVNRHRPAGNLFGVRLGQVRKPALSQSPGDVARRHGHAVSVERLSESKGLMRHGRGDRIPT
jgi:hypothetical protein